MSNDNDSNSSLANKRALLDPAKSEESSDAADLERSRKKKRAKFIIWQTQTMYWCKKLMQPSGTGTGRVGPDLLNTPEMEPLRNFAGYCISNAEEYGFDNTSVYFSEEELIQILDKSFILNLQGEDYRAPDGYEPIIQIIGINSHKEEGYGPNDNIWHTIEASVTDASNNTLRARIASAADGAKCLQIGHVVKLKMFHRFVINSREEKNNGMTEVALLLIRFDTIGRGPTNSSDNREIVAHPTANINDRLSKGNEAAEDGKDEVVSLLHVPGDSVDESKYKMPPTPAACTSKNRLCSVYGQNFFAHCICEQMPVRDVDLEAVYNNYFATTEPLESMSNRLIRNMLYWMYATNVYMICGSKKRGKLPDCLVYAIRCAYPNDKDEEYVGFEAYGSQT